MHIKRYKEKTNAKKKQKPTHEMSLILLFCLFFPRVLLGCRASLVKEGSQDHRYVRVSVYVCVGEGPCVISLVEQFLFGDLCVFFASVSTHAISFL